MSCDGYSTSVTAELLELYEYEDVDLAYYEGSVVTLKAVADDGYVVDTATVSKRESENTAAEAELLAPYDGDGASSLKFTVTISAEYDTLVDVRFVEEETETETETETESGDHL